MRDAFCGLEGDWAWLDNAGGSFTLKNVIRRVGDYMSSTPIQLGGNYPLSKLAADRQAQVVAGFARFINAKSADEIVLGSSSTALTWQVARAMRPLLSAGDEIVITRMDHEANRSPWLWLQELGVKVRTWEIDDKAFSLSMEHLDTLLNDRTRLVCFSHCSNILGKIEPVAEIARRAHAKGARVFVDGVAYAPHRRVDVDSLDVDFYVCSLYKIFGPHIGMLYGKREALLELGNISHEYLSGDTLPYKLQPGGVSYELAWGAGGIVEYFDDWQQRSGEDPFDLIASHEADLLHPLLGHLATQARVTILGPTTSDPGIRLPIVAFRHKEKSSAEIVAGLNERKLAARYGHFHSRRLLERLEIPVDDGVVRISLAHYNTGNEIDRLVAALQALL